ncbi:hypothetical protein HU200_037905 [Digitaria exilis]|uniref:Uncharacterized protein n=1 Tax=Digitaria exilis TaxID=1010633 RepID=A0A835EKV7_9POAL|nr:hypothetical protein HU200_037905 [Digitaria exilis]
MNKGGLSRSNKGRSNPINNEDIPEEVICYTIIPRLPFKWVMSLKAISSVAGNIKMPWKLQGSNFEGWECHSIDVSNNGMLLCTTIDKDGLSMYKLVKVDGQCWELKHKKGWKDIMEMSGDALQFCHSMKLRNGWRKFYERWSVRPLGVESGQWVYLMLKVERKRSHKVLRYDIDTGKVDNFIKESGTEFSMYRAFGYRNSMAPIPPIHVPTL